MAETRIYASDGGKYRKSKKNVDSKHPNVRLQPFEFLDIFILEVIHAPCPIHGPVSETPTPALKF